MSIPNPQHDTHECGGTILAGPHTEDGQQYYCDRCGAYRHDGSDDDRTLPTGTDPRLNRQANDDGDMRSPDHDTHRQLSDREKYQWASEQQGFDGSFEDWQELDATTRQEYEDGAAGIPTA